MWQGSASMADLEKNVTTFDWDLGPKPMGPKSRGYIVSADMFGINAVSKNKDAAWRFLKYLTSTEGQQIYSKAVGRAPTRRSAFPYFQTLFPKRSTIYQTLGMMEGQVSPDTFMSVDVNNLLLKTIREQVATKNKNVQQAMDEIADALTAIAQK
jgi:multiple sugar transport system substrate-binding protein